MEWVIAGVVVIALFAFWRWRQGADERRLAEERARSEMFRGLMADRALEARADRPPTTAFAGCRTTRRYTARSFAAATTSLVRALREKTPPASYWSRAIPSWRCARTCGAARIHTRPQRGRGARASAGGDGPGWRPGGARCTGRAPLPPGRSHRHSAGLPRDRALADAFELSPASETGARSLFDAETTTLLLDHPGPSSKREARGYRESPRVRGLQHPTGGEAVWPAVTWKRHGAPRVRRTAGGTPARPGLRSLAAVHRACLAAWPRRYRAIKPTGKRVDLEGMANRQSGRRTDQGRLELLRLPDDVPAARGGAGRSGSVARARSL